MMSRSPQSGRITALVQQARSRNRTSVFIDGKFAFGIWTDLVLSSKLHVGKELSEAELNSLFRSESVLQGRSAALRYLAYAPRTKQQVRERLRQRGYSEEIIRHVIQDLCDLGYIDDSAYAMEYAEARFRNKGYGPERIRRELIADGVSWKHINQAIAANVSQDDLITAGRCLVEKFQNRVQGSLSKRKKKLTDYLIRRGYEHGMARELVQQVLRGESHG